jgi:uncharacterized protein (TIGR03437 family)
MLPPDKHRSRPRIKETSYFCNEFITQHTSAELCNPYGVAVDPAGNLYIADTCNSRIRKVAGGVISTVAGNGTPGFSGDSGPATSVQLYNPYGVAVDPAGILYIADSGNSRIRKVAGGVISTVAGNGSPSFSGDNGPATSAGLGLLQGVAVDPVGNLYVATGNRIRKISGGVITTIAGGGSFFPGSCYKAPSPLATSVQLADPSGVAVDSAGNVFFSDAVLNCIQEVSNGVITDAAGSGAGPGFKGDNGSATSVDLCNPSGIAVDSTGNLYIADTCNLRIRLATRIVAPIIDQNGVVPIYSSVPVIQSGSWVSIFGTNLASGTFLWNGDFPTSLGGTSVTIDNKSAYLSYVGPTQINLQAPDDTATGTVNVVVTTALGTTTSSVDLALQGPSFCLLGDDKHVAGEIATPNGMGAYGGGSYDLVGPSGAFSFNTRPVNPGETLILYGVGFGPTNPPVPAGSVFSGSAPTSNPVAITIGGVSASVVFAGITEAGLYQFNLTVPNAGSGDQALLATVNGVQTQSGPVVTVQ